MSINVCATSKLGVNVTGLGHGVTPVPYAPCAPDTKLMLRVIHLHNALLAKLELNVMHGRRELVSLSSVYFSVHTELSTDSDHK